MKSTHSIFLATALAVLGVCTAQSQVVVVSDNYNTNTSGTGFALGSGVNTGINPPTTRITGTAAPNLRYLQTATTRTASKYDINSNRLRVVSESTIGRFTLSANGASAFDFGPALGSPYATPANPAIYDVKISMRNDATSNARFSFAITTAESDANSWDFGIQMYRTTTTIDYYTIQKRVDTASSGTAADINTPMFVTGPNSTNSMQAFLIRVTDAGAESTTYSSRIQVSTNNGASWIYDTQGDPDLPNGFRFDGPGRVIDFDQASNGSGNVFYDNFSITSISSPVPPAAAVWTGGGADNNWSTADNWGGSAPINGQPITFDGTTRQANVNDLTSFDTPFVTFNVGGFSLSGNPFSISSTISNIAGVNTFAGDISFSSTGVKTWNIASGSELKLNNTTTIEVNGDHSITGGGTLHSFGTVNIGQATTANPAFSVMEGTHIIDASAFTTRGGYRIGSLPTGAGAQTVITNGGSLSLTATSGNLRVGDSSNPNAARLNIDNGSIFLSGNAVLAVSYAAGATGTVTQNGGLVSVPILSFDEVGAGAGSYSIKNGALAARVIRKNNSSGSASIYFDNATVTASPGSSNAFFGGLDVAQIQPGGLVIEAQSDVTIAQALSGTGSLIKSNFSSVILTGANTYAGDTIILSGRLAMANTQTNSSVVQVSDGAEFGVFQRTLGSTLNVPAVHFNGASGSTMSFDLGTLATPTAPMMKVGNLSVNGNVVINIANGLQLTPGTIVLVDYDGAITGGYRFSLGSLPPGMSATLVNNTANGSIDLNITGVPGFRWTGATSGDWDGFTQNWVNQQNGTPSTYSDGYPTTFDDNATTGNVNITGLPTPAIITVSNNTLPYVWSNGGITVNTLVKLGAGTLTRVESGADIIANYEIDKGTLALSNSFDTTMTTVLTDVNGGTGTFAKQGLSTLTVTSTNSTYDASVLVQQGNLKIGNDRALGSTSAKITIVQGGTLDLNDKVPGAEPVFVSGDGYQQQGAIIDSTSGGAVDTNLRDVTMTGDTTFGAPNGGRWDLRIRSGTGVAPGLKGNGYNLTKVGSGYVSIACQRNLGTNTPYWDMNLGDVIINGGTLAFAESLTLGNPSKSIYINSGAAIQLYDLNATNPMPRNIYMSDGKLNGGGANTDTNVLTGTINITGSDSIRPDQCVMFINGPITGPGSLAMTANEPGRVYLNGANTFVGDLTVSSGTLGGTGSMVANLVMLGGTFAPGQLDVVGTFSVSGNVNLGGTNVFELNRGLSPNSDRLNVGGNLSFGGILKVVLGVGAPAPQAGDVYQLFNKGSSSSFSSISLPDISALPGNLSWNTDNLAVNGTISVNGTVVAPNPPTITSVSWAGTNVVFSGTGGVQGNNYFVLTSTDVASHSTNWTRIATNQFGAGGSFSVTNPITGSMRFFELQVP
jgi:autotransporter-associated beta strand protein